MKYKLTIEFDSEMNLHEWKIRDSMLYGRTPYTNQSELTKDIQNKILLTIVDGRFILERIPQNMPICLTYVGDGSRFYFTTAAQAADFLMRHNINDYELSITSKIPNPEYDGIMAFITRKL